MAMAASEASFLSPAHNCLRVCLCRCCQQCWELIALGGKNSLEVVDLEALLVGLTAGQLGDEGGPQGCQAVQRAHQLVQPLACLHAVGLALRL